MLSVDTVGNQTLTKQIERENLVSQLETTDYVLIKITEYLTLDIPLTQDYTEVLNNRQTWRDRIQAIDDE